MIISNVAQIIGDQVLVEVHQDDSVLHACKIMGEHDRRALIVNDGEQLAGILSERDVIRNCICASLPLETTRVAEVMTAPVQALDADASLADAIDLMKKGHFHHAPVLRDGKPIGMLSNDDIPEEYRMLLERFKEMRGG